MGLLSRLAEKAKKSLAELVADNLPESVTEAVGARSGQSSPSALRSTSTPPPFSPGLDDDYVSVETEINESYFDEDYNEDSYAGYMETSDADLAEFGERVDRLIQANDGYVPSHEMMRLHTEAQSYGISVEEFDMMLQARIAELQDAIEAGYPREAVYRTRSVWRRCPNCGSLNDANDMYCYWCGYQLRHRVASAVLGALIYAGVTGGDPHRLHKKSANKSHVKAKTAQQKRKTTKAAATNGKLKKKAASTPHRSASASAARPLTPRQAPSTSRPLSRPSASSAGSTTRSAMFGSKPAAAAPKKSSSSSSIFGGSSSSSRSSKKSSSSSSSSKKSIFSSSSSKSSSKKSSSLLGGSKKKSSIGGGLLKSALGKKRR